MGCSRTSDQSPEVLVLNCVHKDTFRTAKMMRRVSQPSRARTPLAASLGGRIGLLQGLQEIFFPSRSRRLHGKQAQGRAAATSPTSLWEQNKCCKSQYQEVRVATESNRNCCMSVTLWFAPMPGKIYFHGTPDCRAVQQLLVFFFVGYA